MKTSQDFWNATASLITVTERHPFLVAMVDGTLSMESFRYYVVQDALYLNDFADCLRRLGQQEAACGHEDTAQRLEAFAMGAEEAELSLHNSFFKEWDITAEGVDQMPHTLLYTSFMKRVVATRPHAEGLAALLPCFWVYMHVGQCMLKLRDKLGDRYATCQYCWFLQWMDLEFVSHFSESLKKNQVSLDHLNSMHGSICMGVKILNAKFVNISVWWMPPVPKLMNRLSMPWKITLRCVVNWSICFGIRLLSVCNGLISKVNNDTRGDD